MHTNLGEGESGFQKGCWCKQTEKNPGLLDTPHTMDGRKRQKEKKVWIYPLF